VSIIKIFDENFSVKIVATKLESVQSKYDASSANARESVLQIFILFYFYFYFYFWPHLMSF